ncbi:hypothetical protein PMAYCL1PPCAC_01904 [Pristionchus mayeri]|uniref:Uncharacterized protein n=1 Tax=Pristionchus mayeri TaxID=1317129 RepID=A0AAN4Z1N4_9BILA|nr:hypothetical protein PMAYCL1PPCAC_01904 [Pristionchus mayeri]
MTYPFSTHELSNSSEMFHCSSFQQSFNVRILPADQSPTDCGIDLDRREETQGEGMIRGWTRFVMCAFFLFVRLVGQ